MIRSAIANQMQWDAIDAMIEEAKANQDPVATYIDDVSYPTNSMTLMLR